MAGCCRNSPQLITAHCNIPLHAATPSTHCNKWQHTVAYCNTLHDIESEVQGTEHSRPTSQHTTTHCNTLQHTTTHYNTLQHAVTNRLKDAQSMARKRFKTLQHHATQCSTMQPNASHYNTMQTPQDQNPRWKARIIAG